MPDIFLSYNREDQPVARRVAEAFEREGFSVWWDAALRSGEAYDQVTERALKTAKAVVVLWSKCSVESRWVRAEATLADRNKTLVPAMIEPCDRPIMFELTQTADLSHWDGSPTDVAWKAFVADVTRFVEARVSPAPSDRSKSSTSPASAAPGSLSATPLSCSTGPSPAFPSPPLRSAGAPAASSAPADRSSICVLPFANMSRDDDQEYFADGISEDIITDLSKVSALEVISRNSAFAFKGKHVDLRHVAKQLGVTHVLEGSVRKSGNRVRITAQLIDASRDSHVWAERYDRDLADIFALQDEISQAIVAALKLKLFPEEKKAIEDRGTSSVEAYDRYLRARALLHQQGPVELRRAIQIFREALALDPGFVPAWHGLHRAHEDSITYVAESTDEVLAGMAEAADRILALAPDAWLSHTLRANQLNYQRRWFEAEAAFTAAVTAAPASDVDATLGYALFLMNVGRVNESARYAERGRQTDPLSLWASMLTQVALGMSGHSAQAEAEYERSKDVPGDRDAVEHYALFRALARRDAAAKGLVERIMLYQTVPITGLDDLPQIFDQRGAMLARLRLVQADAANQDATRQYKIALWAGWHGDPALAAVALRRSFLDLHFPRVGAIWASPLSETRGTPAFKEIVCELGLADYWRRSGHWGDFARPLGEDDFEVIR